MERLHQELGVVQTTELLAVEDGPVLADDLRRCFPGLAARVWACPCAARATVEFLRAHRVDLVLMSIDARTLASGLLVAGELRKLAVPFVFVTADQTLDLVALTAAGPRALVCRPFPDTQLRATVAVSLIGRRREECLLQATRRSREQAAALQGRNQRLERCLHSLCCQLADLGFTLPGREVREHEGLAGWRSILTSREFDVLLAFVTNGRVDLVARALAVSATTVRNHLKAIYRKTGLHSQAELLGAAREVLTPPPAAALPGACSGLGTEIREGVFARDSRRPGRGPESARLQNCNSQRPFRKTIPEERGWAAPGARLAGPA